MFSLFYAPPGQGTRIRPAGRRRRLALKTALITVLAGLTSGSGLAATQPEGPKSPRAKSASTHPASAKPAPGGEERILVRARRREQMSVSQDGHLGVLGKKRGLDVPFSVKTFSESLITNQQAQTLGQVLANDPAVRTTTGYGNFSELFVLRGFPVPGDDVQLGGLYGIAPRQLLDPQIFGDVEVVNGATAFLNGMAPAGSVGGTIDLEFKHAGPRPLLRVTGDYTSNAQGGGSVDMGRRFGQEKQWGMRLNVAGMDGQTSVEHEKRHATALGFDTDWHNDDTRITLDMNYENQGVNWGRPDVFLSGQATRVPHPVKATHNFGQRWSYNNLDYLFGMLGIEHDFGEHVMVYGKFGGLSGDERGRYGNFYETDNQGNGYNGAMYVPYQQNNESTLAGMRAHFATGPVHHEMNAGGSGLWETVNTAYAMGSAYPASNLYHPTYTPLPAMGLQGGDIHNPKKINDERLYSLFFSDTMKFFDERVELTGGFRFQNILQNNFSYQTRAKTSGYDRSAITPVAGLVVHVTRHASLYFNRVEGLSAGPVAPAGTTNTGQAFAPYRTVQYEIGAKYQMGRINASLGFYRMSQPNAFSEADPAFPGQSRFVVDGMQRNQGIEADVNGEIIKGLRFNGGVSITQATQRRTAGGLTDGLRAIGVPGYSINGNVEYDLPFIKGLTLTGRVMRTGHQWLNLANTQRVHGWTTWDVGARYTFALQPKRPMTLRFGVQNLTNASYWSSAMGGYLYEGLPRTFQFSLSTDL
ncbi:TonB-dependent receptor [Oecophyllibacter saccharovorans]|uniref:TonB-dependent receptor n=1 Tax=Oecophyllibacter saccharovorans TaxID=2558360 RepID=UPI001142FE6F|nr:TonB-dependent receptor [Oecophyllibacter saccharovorans]QDH15700.1 TonB-dependent receptor [Oecophyllibacter saccharovorans]